MSQKTNKNRGLGRGLSALMSDIPAHASGDQTSSLRPDMMVPIEQVSPNPHQPRRTFEDGPMAELAASILEKGIIQPLIVRKSGNSSFEIVAGERRWRAAQIAKLHEIPVLVRDFDDTEVLEVAIIENIQRADLNPIDEAHGYKQLLDKFGHTQEQLAKALGKSRSHIANLMRLLTLPSVVIGFLVDGRLSAGHARALVGHQNAERLARHIVQNGLSVRDAEKLAKKDQGGSKSPKPAPARVVKDADTVQIEGELAAQIGMPVTIDHVSGQEGGKLSIKFRSLEQLDDLLRLLSGQ